MAFKTSGKTDIDRYVIGRVKEMREERKMSQAILAVKLGVADSFIGYVESPKRVAKYNLNHINKLAEIFECSPKDFLPEKPI